MKLICLIINNKKYLKVELSLSRDFLNFYRQFFKFLKHNKAYIYLFITFLLRISIMPQ